MTYNNKYIIMNDKKIYIYIITNITSLIIYHYKIIIINDISLQIYLHK